MNILEKNSYRIENDLLTIRSICGEYSFKMEESGTTDHVHRIAQMMVSEMAKAEESFGKAGATIKPYVLVLLANLNLSKKYIELRDRLDQLNRTLEKKTRTLADVKPRPPKTQLFSQVQPMKARAETALLKTTLESDIIDDLQKLNTLLSDPISAPPAPERTEIPSPEPGNTVASSASEPAKRPVPAYAAPEPSLASATEPSLAPASATEPTSESTDTTAFAAPSDPPKAPEPPHDPEPESIPEVRGVHPKVPLQGTVVTAPPLPIAPSPEERHGTEVVGEATAMAAQTSTSTPDTAEPVQHTVVTVTTDHEPTKPLPETAITGTESENPLAAETTWPPPGVGNDAPLMEAVEKEKPATHEETAPMGSFPIHTAATYSAARSARPHIKKEPREGTFELPSLKFLKNINSKTEVDHESIRRDAELLEKKLGYFGIKGEVMGVSPGPVITTFEYKPDPGIKISKIVNLADDLALALSAYSIRIVAPIPGKDVMGIEIPNLKKSIVPFIDIVSSEDFINSTSKLPICLGKDIIGNPVVVELESMPHLLIAGATGTGKSVGLNAMITSILYKANPDEVKFLMIDPKRIELSLYNDIPHLITPVITDMKKATTALQWMVREMERRYDLLAKYQVRNIEQFNQKIKKMNSKTEESYQELPEPLSYIVIIIDELADLMMTASRDVELSLTRLAQMARAAGIHLILATQRPSVDVLTGIIKANFPTRISFQVSSKTDSRTIIDSNGAETLLGMGDMLFVPPGTARLTRVHGTYLSEEELIDVTTFLKAQQAPDYLFDVITEQQEEPEPEYMDDEYDEKYHEALEVVMATRQASISGIQRALRVGYNRAARIIDIMEKKGIVGPSDGSKPRQVLSGPMD